MKITFLVFMEKIGTIFIYNIGIYVEQVLFFKGKKYCNNRSKKIFIKFSNFRVSLKLK